MIEDMARHLGFRKRGAITAYGRRPEFADVVAMALMVAAATEGDASSRSPSAPVSRPSQADGRHAQEADGDSE
jgi:hypothetical protein